MVCQSCGTQIADNAKFCDNCGTQTAAEQARIHAQQEKNRQKNPHAYLDVKTAIIITVVLFVILPIPCLFADAPLVLGFATAGVLGSIYLSYYGHT